MAPYEFYGKSESLCERMHIAVAYLDSFTKTLRVVDEQRSHTLGGRGSAKFDAKLADTIETTTTGAASTLRSRSGRDRKTQSPSRRVSNPERNNDRPSSRNLDDASQVEEPFGSRDRKLADKNVDSGKISNAADSRQRASRRNDRKYLPEQDEKRESRKLDQDVTLEAPRPRKENSASRRGSSRGSLKKETDQNLDNNTGPSVFSGITENSRSRTGRKIQTAYNDRELKKQVPTSRRFGSQSSDVESSTSSSRRSSNKSRGSTKSTDDSAARKKLDVSLTESESVRVDIPLTLATTDYPAYTTIINDINENPNISPRSSSRNAERHSDDKELSRSNTKESRNSERTKNRGRANDDVETSNTRAVNSRRGSSRFVDFTTPETIEVSSVRSKSRTEGRSSVRGRNPEQKSRNSGSEPAKSRSKGRSLDIVPRSVSNGVSGQGEIKRRSSGDRNSPDGRSRNTERKSKQAENKVQDQDARGRSRGKARTEVTTLKTLDVPTPIALEITTWPSESTTIPVSEPSITTVRASGQRESTRTTTEGSSRARGRKRANGQGRNSGKEDYFNQGLGFRGRKFPIDGVTKNPSDSVKISTVKVDNYVRGNPGWTLRRRPSHGDKLETSSVPTTSTSTATTVREQINEIAPSDDRLNNKESSTVNPTTRRGPKKSKNNESSTVASTTNDPRKANQNSEKGTAAKIESEESDNYPPDFKARILQLKNSNAKIPAIKSTPRPSTEGKKISANLFSERSKLKLELARRLVKPELSDQANVLDVTTPISPSKLRSTDVPIAEETKKVAKLAKTTPSSRQDDRRKVEKAVKQLKLSRARKVLDEEHSDLETRTSRPKKGRVISERTVTSISVEEDPSNYVVETVTKITEEVSSMKIDASQLRQSSSRKENPEDVAATTLKPVKTFSTTLRNPVKNIKQGNLFARRTKSPEKDSSTTPVGSFNVPEEATKFPYLSSTTDSNELSSSTNDNVKPKTKTLSTLNSVTRSNFQSNYPKKLKQKTVEDTNEIPQQTTARTSSATSRYTRKKIEAFKPFDPIPKTTTESIQSTVRRREYRPRTATYRRHSELPTTLVQSTTKVDSTPGVAITPKTPKYSASLKSSTPTARSIAQEPQVSVRISNDTTVESGITDSSNGDTGTSNIFNPTRSAFLSGNSTLLEQLRSTVAPLLNSLGNKTPIFASSYRNVNNGSSTPRITPNGSSPRFSARYKGAELFVRKPSSGYQPTVPSITSSSTTPATPLEVFTTKTTDNFESVAPPSWSTDLGITRSPVGILDSQSLDTNNLR
ncbi:hypothetical protein KPH14_003035 [Odynerus spinipes]|uniref:Uncharacterized protein n=1 Tax=Odynerus spinipes TaxID=1348599 RepID=A0AAD9RY28_9HYME|nr:hypothetical protein KPH14_003035 [Odynerus spinipes]